MSQSQNVPHMEGYVCLICGSPMSLHRQCSYCTILCMEQQLTIRGKNNQLPQRARVATKLILLWTSSQVWILQDCMVCHPIVFFLCVENLVLGHFLRLFNNEFLSSQSVYPINLSMSAAAAFLLCMTFVLDYFPVVHYNGTTVSSCLVLFPHDQYSQSQFVESEHK